MADEIRYGSNGLERRVRDVEIRMVTHDARITVLEELAPTVRALDDESKIEQAVRGSHRHLVRLVVGAIGLIQIIATTIVALLVIRGKG